MKPALKVVWDGARVGTLRINAAGDMVFAYDRNWVEDPARPAISASLPKQLAAFSRRRSRPFFAGLLPDERQRAGVARVLGVSEQNDFGLLDALGGEVAGALVLCPENEEPPTPEVATPRPLGDAELAALLENLPRRPMLAGETELRLSLAGAQPKLPVVLVEGRVALPARGQPTTHILKPALRDWPGTTENEAFCLRLAAVAGLPAVRAEPHRVGAYTFLLVERYDRVGTADTGFTRVHQEDFCQALGITPEHKYAAEGGPTFKSSFALLRRISTRPAVDVLRLLDAAIFNAVIGNADAHGKNFSLLYGAGGAVLTPLYDLMATIVYPDVSAKPAMRIAKAVTIEELDRKTWLRFAVDAGLAGPFVPRRVRTLCAAIEKAGPAVAAELTDAGFGSEMLETIARTVRDRAARLDALVASVLDAREFAAEEKRRD